MLTCPKSVLYGSGQFVGDEYMDTVSIGPGMRIFQQSIGAATKSEGFDGVDGILGCAFGLPEKHLTLLTSAQRFPKQDWTCRTHERYSESRLRCSCRTLTAIKELWIHTFLRSHPQVRPCRRTVTCQVNTRHPVTDNLFSQKHIQQNIVSVSFEPTTREVAVNGEVTFGGIDHRKFTGPLTFTYVKFFE